MSHHYENIYAFVLCVVVLILRTSYFKVKFIFSIIIFECAVTRRTSILCQTSSNDTKIQSIKDRITFIIHFLQLRRNSCFSEKPTKKISAFLNIPVPFEILKIHNDR